MSQQALTRPVELIRVDTWIEGWMPCLLILERQRWNGAFHHELFILKTPIKVVFSNGLRIENDLLPDLFNLQVSSGYVQDGSIETETP